MRISAPRKAPVWPASQDETLVSRLPPLNFSSQVSTQAQSSLIKAVTFNSTGFLAPENK
jgi:hypothetical protein